MAKRNHASFLLPNILSVAEFLVVWILNKLFSHVSVGPEWHNLASLVVWFNHVQYIE